MNRLRYFVASWLFVVVSLFSLHAQADDHHLHRGDTGPAVAAVQDRLHTFGYTVTVDGRYGAQTERAVRHWQRANGLVVDGIIGPQTLSTFGDLSSDRAAASDGARRPVAAPGGNGSPVSPEQVIRDVWPDDVEDRAVAIAWRESRLTPTARNACCFGLFQIHYAAHRAWLGSFGVNRPTDLLDPLTNARVALALYQAAGWDPWRL